MPQLNPGCPCCNKNPGCSCAGTIYRIALDGVVPGPPYQVGGNTITPTKCLCAPPKATFCLAVPNCSANEVIRKASACIRVGAPPNYGWTCTSNLLFNGWQVEMLIATDTVSLIFSSSNFASFVGNPYATYSMPASQFKCRADNTFTKTTQYDGCVFPDSIVLQYVQDTTCATQVADIQAVCQNCPCPDVKGWKFKLADPCAAYNWAWVPGFNGFIWQPICPSGCRASVEFLDPFSGPTQSGKCVNQCPIFWEDYCLQPTTNPCQWGETILGTQGFGALAQYAFEVSLVMTGEAATLYVQQQLLGGLSVAQCNCTAVYQTTEVDCESLQLELLCPPTNSPIAWPQFVHLEAADCGEACSAGTCTWVWSSASQAWTNTQAVCGSGCGCSFPPDWAGIFDGETVIMGCNKE